MSTLIQDKELIEKACRGECDSLSHLAVRAYWGYDTIRGAEDNADVELLMDAAGVCENGNDADKTGNFYKYEINSDKADQFYAYGALRSIDSAVNGDAGSCMKLAEKYAYGKGFEYSDESACFWTQAAADAGSPEGSVMMKNFWQAETVLPASAEMASKQGTSCPPASEEVKELKKALIENEAMRAHKEASEKSKDLVKSYKFTDIRKTPLARLLNPVLTLIINIAQIVLIAYIAISVLAFVINFFPGYRESGFIHYVNKIYDYCLGIPLKLFLTLISDLKFAEITTEILCKNFCFGSSLLIAPFRLLFSGALSAAWLALCSGAYMLFWMILSTIYRQGIKVIPSSSSAKSTECPYNDTAYRGIIAKNPELEAYSTCELMAITSIAQYNNISIKEACVRFAKMCSANETPEGIPTLKVADEYSDMCMYFVLNKVMNMSYVKMPSYHFMLDSDLMRGYRKYRAGKNYKEAERQLQFVIDSDRATTEEKAWAKYFISLMCNDQFLCFTDENKNDDEKTIERGKQLRKEASAYCVLANDDDVNALCARLWSLDCETLTLVSAILDMPELSEYFDFVISTEKARKFNLGDPNNRKDWRDYKTKCLVPKLPELIDEYNKVIEKYNGRTGSFNTYKDFEKELKSLKGKIKALVDKKYMHATDLLNNINQLLSDVVNEIGRLASESIAEDRARQAREDAINRKLSEFDDHADSVERDINSLLSGNMATNLEMHLMGKISDSDIFVADDVRYRQREKLRQKLEDEM